jgi:small subunit ribosomal protein S1
LQHLLTLLEEGQDIKVKVLEVHPAEHRLALSIKALEEAPKNEKRAPTEAPAADFQQGHA